MWQTARKCKQKSALFCYDRNRQKNQISAAEAGMNNYDLATKASVGYRTIHTLLNSDSTPNASTVGKVAKALGTTPEWLLDGTGERNSVQEEGPVWGVMVQEKAPT